MLKHVEFFETLFRQMEESSYEGQVYFNWRILNSQFDNLGDSKKVLIGNISYPRSWPCPVNLETGLAVLKRASRRYDSCWYEGAFELYIKDISEEMPFYLMIAKPWFQLTCTVPRGSFCELPQNKNTVWDLSPRCLVTYDAKEKTVTLNGKDDMTEKEWQNAMCLLQGKSLEAQRKETDKAALQLLVCYFILREKYLHQAHGPVNYGPGMLPFETFLLILSYVDTGDGLVLKKITGNTSLFARFIVVRQVAETYLKERLALLKTPEDVARFMDLMANVKEKGVGWFWSAIQEKVADTLFAEFRFDYEGKDDPYFISFVQGGRETTLDDETLKGLENKIKRQPNYLQWRGQQLHMCGGSGFFSTPFTREQKIGLLISAKAKNPDVQHEFDKQFGLIPKP